jgi:hypothetical protein
MTKFKKIKKTFQRYKNTIISCLALVTFTFGFTAINMASIEDNWKEPAIKAGVENYIPSKGETLKTYGLIEPLSTKMVFEHRPDPTTTTIEIIEIETIEIGTETTQELYSWNGPVLNSRIGTVQGPNGKETYYNLPMHGVIQIMRNAGFNETEYPYWIRNDGCKMLGDYIMVAADLSIRPRGSIIETSLGTALVCDTGSFANYNSTQIDIAVDW